MANAAPPYGGRPLIVDSSAWSALRRARKIGNVPPEWTAALESDQLRTSPIVRLEILHSARNRDEFDAWNERLSALREVRVDYPICLAAIAALRELTAVAPEYHRVGLGDALIAASAQEAGVGVLHYNPKDFDKLAEVLHFDSVPFGSPGAFET
jgi:predicted nucleic acid-binding protein